MIKLNAVSSKQMSSIDRRTIEEVMIPGIVLMENAALKVFQEVMRTIKKTALQAVGVFAGKGNNGGDAFSVAKHLYNNSIKTKVFLLAPKNQIKGDALTNLIVLENIGLEVYEVIDHRSLKELEESMKDIDIIVDGIFGTGLKSKITGLQKEIIEKINSTNLPIISVDVPSGLDCTTGKIQGICVKATKTVTFGLPKIGQFLYPGYEYIGELIIEDIGIPKKVIESEKLNTFVIDSDMVAGLIPKRHSESNKGSFGKTFIITGSTGMTGSGILAGSAALRVGSGLVYLGVPGSLINIYESLIAESITIPLPDTPDGKILDIAIEKIALQVKKSSVVAVGPGLSIYEEILKIVKYLIQNSNIPVVLDADALNVLAYDVGFLNNRLSEIIITPHPGEMAKLTGKTIQYIQNNRIEVASQFAVENKVITVLKGARTIIAAPNGEVFINPTGNPGMASGGMGDVLTGIISGLIAQGLKPISAAILGVFLHGETGDRVCKIKGENSIIASDLIYELPYVIKEIKDVNSR